MKLFSQGSFIQRVKERAAQKDESLLAAGRQVAKGIALGYLLYYALLILVIIGLLAVIGFTDLLGGPFVVAQVILFLLVGTLLLLIAGLLWIWQRVKKTLSRLDKTYRKRTDATDTTVTKTLNINGKTYE